MDHSPIRKFYKYSLDAEAQGKKVYYLNIGQPDILTPPCFLEATQNFNEPIVEYMPSQGVPELITSVKNYYNYYGIGIGEKDILITSGGSEALYFALMTIANDGDEIIVPEPFYSNYNIFIKSTGAKITPITTQAEDGFFFADEELIVSKITKRTKAILIANPGNPTGTVLSIKEMRMIAEIAKKYNLFIIADEVYREFVYDGIPMTSFAELPDVTENVIIIDSVSKRFSACGARVGCLVSRNEAFLDHVLKLCQGRLSAPTLDQYGAVALYNLPHSYFDDIRDEYEKRRNIAYEMLMEMDGVVCEKPSGAFYITAKLPVPDTERFLIWLLCTFENNKETIMFAPGGGFYETPGLGKDEIRIAYVLGEKELRRSMELLKLGLEKYRTLI